MSKHELFEIDFYKEFELPRPVACGLVNKITSPKGIRTKNEQTGNYHYQLHTDLKQIYEAGIPANVDEGLYWVMDVYKYKGSMTWNHYLFVVESDGTIYPIAEFLDYSDSSWIKEAINIIKDHFSGDEFEPIEITLCKADVPTVQTIHR